MLVAVNIEEAEAAVHVEEEKKQLDENEEEKLMDEICKEQEQILISHEAEAESHPEDIEREMMIQVMPPPIASPADDDLD